ncbi:hypothetical protein [Paraburkholderia oxyphila]|uniref:hypothetical protein n=1 Tax=Paraburkholderia oxyphila TaxID=614212 RepID=UPI0012EEDF47|nr:hypothetical protein [Paraburkholderia oxyphila]
MKRITITILLMIAAVLLVTLMVVLKTAPPQTVETVGSASAPNGSHVAQVLPRIRAMNA